MSPLVAIKGSFEQREDSMARELVNRPTSSSPRFDQRPCSTQ